MTEGRAQRAINIFAVPSLSTLGWVFLLPPPLLNLPGVVIMLRGYEQARNIVPCER